MSTYCHVKIIPYFGSIISRNPAERFIAIHNWVVDNLSVCQQEAAVGYKKLKPIKGNQCAEILLLNKIVSLIFTFFMSSFS